MAPHEGMWKKIIIKLHISQDTFCPSLWFSHTLPNKSKITLGSCTLQWWISGEEERKMKVEKKRMRNTRNQKKFQQMLTLLSVKWKRRGNLINCKLKAKDRSYLPDRNKHISILIHPVVLALLLLNRHQLSPCSGDMLMYHLDHTYCINLMYFVQIMS